MKKILIYSLVATLGLAGCKKTERIFNESPDERLNATLAEDQKVLMSAPYGWRGLIFPKGLEGGVVGFYFNFTDTNRVEMFSDFDSASSVTLSQSSYRLKALQQPALIFDTYNYVHVLADPDASVNGGSYGSGLQSDFEFAIDTVKGDTVKLTGRFNGSKAYLVKATQQEKADYYGKKYGTRVFDNIGKYLTYFKRLVYGSTQYEIQVNTGTRTVTFTWVDSNGNVQTYTTGYYYTTTGIAFTPPFTDGTVTIASLDNMTWNAGTTTLSFTANGTASSIVGATAPIKPDVDAPTRWWNYALSHGGYWVTLNGFHVNGVDDAYGITKTTNYYYTIYWPQYGTSGNTTYDLFAPIQLENGGLALNYGFAYRQPPSVSSDGRMTFSYLGYLGTFTSSSDSVAATKSRILMADTRGYYFVQTGSNSYDMVGARDAKSWISWVYPG
jgi:hypothetical protein